jgi:hypothetical protein
MRRSIRVSVTVISSTAGIAIRTQARSACPARLDICVTSSKGEYPKICRVEGAGADPEASSHPPILTNGTIMTSCNGMAR